MNVSLDVYLKSEKFCSREASRTQLHCFGNFHFFTYTGYCFDTEVIAKGKNCTRILPLEKLKRKYKLASQKIFLEAYDPNLAILFTQTNDPNNKNKSHFRIICKYCHESNHSIPTGFINNEETKNANEIHFLDRNDVKSISSTTLNHIKVRVIQMNNLPRIL